MSDTKEKILQTSLYLFALDGYEAVSVSNIADEIDISKGALYKHYENKRDIFNSIIERMKMLENEQAARFEIPQRAPSEDIEDYRRKSFEIVKDYAFSSFHFWTEEPFPRDFRRMIMLEQFRNPEMNDLYQNFLVTGPVKKLTNIFTTLQKGNPESLANKFYSQIYLLISMSDSAEPQLNTETLLKEHIEDFAERYFFIRKEDSSHRGLLQRANELNK